MTVTEFRLQLARSLYKEMGAEAVCSELAKSTEIIERQDELIKLLKNRFDYTLETLDTLVARVEFRTTEVRKFIIMNKEALKAL